MQHPTLRLRLTAEKTDYDYIGAKFPRIAPSYVTVVSDTGAQSCLWGLKDFYRYGFIKSDLLPVKHSMVAANSERINIVGAILVRLSGLDDHGRSHTAPIMVYISSSTKRFYLSREALIQLGVISKDFPRVGAAMESCSVERREKVCGCPVRSLPPEISKFLPFPCSSENNTKMKKCLIARTNS